MGFFRDYPNTDFHEMNLDFLLEEYAKNKNQYDDLLVKFGDLQTAYEELKKFVNEYFEGLDIQEEIDNKLDEMYESGQLAQMIADYISNQANFPSIFSANVLNNKLHYSSETYYIAQGGVLLDDSNVAYTLAPSGADVGENVKLIIADVNTRNTVRSSILPIGHANSLAYDGTNIYVASTGNYLYVVDPVNLQITNTITYSFIVTAVTCSNDKLYILSPGLVTRVFDLDDLNTPVSTFTIVNSDIKYGINQLDFDFYQNRLYCMCAAPSCLFIVDTNTHNIIKSFNAPKYLERITLQESEFITHNSKGDFVIGWNTTSSNLGTFEEIIFTKTNLSKGNVSENQIIPQLYSSNVIVTAYVNINYTGYFSDGSADYPYKEIQQALNDINVPKSSIRLIVDGGNYDLVKATSICFWVQNAGTGNITINGLRVEGNSTIWLPKSVKFTTNPNISNYHVYVDTGTLFIQSSSWGEWKVFVGDTATFFDSGYHCDIHATGLVIANQVANTDSFVKDKNSATLLGRKLQCSTSVSSQDTNIDLSENINSYSINFAHLTINGYRVTAAVRNGSNAIPFSIPYSDGGCCTGYFLLTITSTSVNVKWFSYRIDSDLANHNWSPSSISLIIESSL